MADTIYVGSLSPEIEEQDVEKLFATYGDVLGVHIFYDEEGKSKGFAFVEMLNPGQADDRDRGIKRAFLEGQAHPGVRGAPEAAGVAAPAA